MQQPNVRYQALAHVSTVLGVDKDSGRSPGVVDVGMFEHDVDRYVQ